MFCGILFLWPLQIETITGNTSSIWLHVRLAGLSQASVVCFFFVQGTLKDSLERYSLYGLEDSTADYDCGFKNEIQDQIKLVSTCTF